MAQEGPSSAFKRANVDFKILGPARVTWEMARHYLGPAPHSFQLQVGSTGNAAADDWADVPGAAGVNVFTLTDNDPRALGKLVTAHYRLKLVDGAGGLYYSNPTTSEGALTKAEWLEAREVIFRETLLNRKFAAVKGYLLKAKRHGPPCVECLDPDTQEVTKSHCDTCKGTRWIGGYYAAMPATYAQLAENETRTNVDAQQNRGTVHDDAKIGRFVGLPQLYSYDVWVDADSDERHFLHDVNVLCHQRGVPLIYDAKLRVIEFGHVVYTVPLEGT